MKQNEEDEREEVIDKGTNIAQSNESLDEKSNLVESISENESESSWSSLEESLLQENSSRWDTICYNPAEAILRSLRIKNETVQHEVQCGFMNCRGILLLQKYYRKVKTICCSL